MAEDNDAPSGTEPAGPKPDPATAANSAQRRPLRMALLAAGPLLVLVAAAYVYMNSGRYIETDNAYVKSDRVVISAEVAGRIVHVGVAENEAVRADSVLLSIDDSSYRLARQRAESQLETVSAFIAGLQASYRQGLEELKLAQSNARFAERELARERSLAERGLGSDSDLDAARHDLDIATQQIPIIEQRLAQLRAQLGGEASSGYEQHAAYQTAKSMLETAELDLTHTVVKAPIGGVASHVPLAGAYVARGAPVMSIVSTEHVWIEANFKETQLTHVAVGQPVVVRVDAYPDREWRGRVQSISQATGAEFSVIPAQNASGNWVKVAQRIPVRIALDGPAGGPPLRAGMSTVVEIDTGYRREAPSYLGILQVLAKRD